MLVPSNRSKYAKGRVTGPSRIVRLNAVVRFLSTEKIPIIIGNPSGRDNFWRRITDQYNAYIPTIAVNTATQKSIVSTTFNYNIDAATNVAISRFTNNGVGFPEFINILRNKNLLLTQLEVNCFRCTDLSLNGNFQGNTSPLAINPFDQLGLYESDVASSTYDRISTKAYITPDYASGLRSNNVRIPLDYVLSDSSAIVLEMHNSTFNIVIGVQIGMTLAELSNDF